MDFFFSLLIKSQDEYTLPSLALIRSQIWLFGAGASGGTNARKRFGLGGPGVWRILTGPWLLSIPARGRPEQKCHSFSCVRSTSFLPKISRLYLWGDSIRGVWLSGALSSQGEQNTSLSLLCPPFSQVEMETFHTQKVDYTQENRTSGQTFPK